MSHADPVNADAVKSILANISDEGHLRVAVNDLVAFEYVHPTSRAWRWALGTVASLPGPRLAQLLLWSGGDEDDTQLPPESCPLSPEERAAAMARLAEVKKMREQVSFEAEEASKELAEKQANYFVRRTEYQQEMENATKTLREAQKQVQEVSEEDWREIRSYSKPPAVVTMVLEAMMVALGERTNTWNDIRVVIRSKDFVKRLLSFDPDKISDASVRKLKRDYYKNPKFTYEDAMNASRALGAIQRWVVANTVTLKAKSGLGKHDKAFMQDKSSIDEMEARIAAFNKAIAAYDKEADELNDKLGTASLKMDHTPRKQASAPAGADGDADAASAAGAAAGAVEPAAEDAYDGTTVRDNRNETVSGTGSTWTLTGESTVVLRAAILINYDRPEAHTVTLSDEQLAQLEDALRRRASPTEQEQQAALARKKLEDAVQDLRGELADANEELKDLKEKQNEHENELRERDRKLEELEEEAGDAVDAAEDRMLQEEALAEKDKEIEDLRKALDEARGAEDKARDALSGNDQANRSLLELVDKLQKEIRKIRSQNEVMVHSLQGVSTILDSDDKIKRIMEEDD